MAKRKRLSFDSPVLPRISGEAPPPIAGQMGDASANAALTELSQSMQTARETGRMVLDLPLGQIVLDHLVRDRLAVDDGDMESLRQSLKTRGQQVPIEVTRLGPNRYGLISGWRRCQALLALEKETGEARFGTVQALIRPKTEAPDAYRAMVEENEIRVGLSYYERARIVTRAVEQGVFATKREALQTLFAAASRAKRSKIGTFQHIVAALDGHLRFPQALTERTGLTLGRALEDDRGLAARARQSLDRAQPQDAAEEAGCLAALLSPPSAAPQSVPVAPDTPAEPVSDPVPKTTAQGEILCPGVEMTLTKGRMVLRGSKVDEKLASRLRVFLTDE